MKCHAKAKPKAVLSGVQQQESQEPAACVLCELARA